MGGHRRAGRLRGGRRHESVIAALIGAARRHRARAWSSPASSSPRSTSSTFAFPTAQVIVFTIAAIIVGILAAIFPARRAAKLNPLEALHYE